MLASGRGSNLAALIDARAEGLLHADIVLVASDRADAGALQLAGEAGMAVLFLDPRRYASRADYDQALFARIDASGAQLLVLAGFMRILDPSVLAPWAGRVINIHPSLLPRYRGLHTHRRALAARDMTHGASVHYVTAELDGGPVIAQASLEVWPDDDEQRLAARLLPLEHRLLPAVVSDIAAGRIRLGGDGRVQRDGEPLTAPLQLEGRTLRAVD